MILFRNYRNKRALGRLANELGNLIFAHENGAPAAAVEATAQVLELMTKVRELKGGDFLANWLDVFAAYRPDATGYIDEYIDLGVAISKAYEGGANMEPIIMGAVAKAVLIQQAYGTREG